MDLFLKCYLTFINDLFSRHKPFQYAPSKERQSTLNEFLIKSKLNKKNYFSKGLFRHNTIVYRSTKQFFLQHGAQQYFTKTIHSLRI